MDRVRHDPGPGLRNHAERGDHPGLDDRPGHDYRYAIDPTKLEQQLDWAPRQLFRDSLTDTVKWFVDNPTWLEKRVAAPERQGLRQIQDADQII